MWLIGFWNVNLHRTLRKDCGFRLIERLPVLDQDFHIVLTLSNTSGGVPFGAQRRPTAPDSLQRSEASLLSDTPSPTTPISSDRQRFKSLSSHDRCKDGPCEPIQEDSVRHNIPNHRKLQPA